MSQRFFQNKDRQTKSDQWTSEHWGELLMFGNPYRARDWGGCQEGPVIP